MPKLRIEPTEADDFRGPLRAVAIGTRAEAAYLHTRGYVMR
jgi:hypothetical protein